MKDEVLIAVVGYNNHVLLQHFIDSLERHEAGYPYRLIIADNSSTDPAHTTLLSRLSMKYTIETLENDRVEVSFNAIAAKYQKQYKYYFFVHDDTCINENNWLKKYIDRLNSGYVEAMIENTEFASLPIGRVGSNHQPWRDYESIWGFPIGSRFLRDYLELYYVKIPSIYKFVDPERTLYTDDCLRFAGGPKTLAIRSLLDFKLLEQIYPPGFKKVCEILNARLPYPDEGIAPKAKYPPNECWNKMTMLSEFLNSVTPLVYGYRSVGLDGDGFLEQVHGHDEPWGHKTVTHYGSPNLKRFLAKKFGTTGEEIHKKLYSKDLAFLVTCDKLIREHFRE